MFRFALISVSMVIGIRLRHLLYNFFRGCLGPFIWENNRKEAQNTSSKSYSKCFRRTQIRWEIWRSVNFLNIFSELQTPPKFARLRWVGRHDTDPTHPNLQRRNGAIPAIHEQTHPQNCTLSLGMTGVWPTQTVEGCLGRSGASQTFLELRVLGPPFWHISATLPSMSHQKVCFP